MCDEVGPSSHKGFGKSGALVGGGCTSESGHFRGVLGPDDGVLTFVGHAAVVCKGVG